MIREIQQVLRLVMCLRRQRQQRGLKSTGGLLVLLWTEKPVPVQSVNCTVAAAGPWCEGIDMDKLQPVLTDLKESMCRWSWSCPQPDPEELCAFTELHGSLRFLLSFQVTDSRLLDPGWCAYLEALLHTFSLANAKIKINFIFKLGQQTFRREFRGNFKRRIAWANQPPLVLDVTCGTRPPGSVMKGRWCLGGHPVCGDQIPLSIPPAAMDHGLFGELCIQPVTLLSPCVLQYPHLATQLTRIQLLVYSPSTVPVTGPSTFFQTLPAHLDCEDLGLYSLHCSPFKDLVHSSGTVYAVEQENSEEPGQESNLSPIQQSLLLFLFLQHSDPFPCQLSDIIATEALIEHHLEDILNNNRQKVTTALQTELKNALKAQNRRQEEREKLRSASEVILNSSVSIVSCSSNTDFRDACLNCMKVHDTLELSASLHESLRRVTSWKFVSRGGCYLDQMDGYLEKDELTRTEL